MDIQISPPNLSKSNTVTVETKEGNQFTGQVDSITTYEERFDDPDFTGVIYQFTFEDSTGSARRVTFHENTTLISEVTEARYGDSELTGDTQRVVDIEIF